MMKELRMIQAQEEKQRDNLIIERELKWRHNKTFCKRLKCQEICSHIKDVNNTMTMEKILKLIKGDSLMLKK